MTILSNRFKQMLATGAQSRGVFIASASPLVVEILAGAGFDWVLIDAEHGPNDPVTVLPQLQAAAAYPVAVLLRPPSHDAALIKQYLGLGVQTLLVPMVETPEQALALVAAMRYPPRGIRGVATRLERGARWGAIDDYAQKADDAMCLIVQIESRRGLENLEAIAAVDGVDGVFIGPADLAASLGHLGQPGHPEVVAAIETALARIDASGKAAGVFAGSESAVRRYRQCGARFVAVGADVSLLHAAAVALASAGGADSAT